MIVYEREHDFVLTAQHEHGLVAGEMASHWKNELLADAAHRDELILAAKEHDRGWIELDSSPFWNDYSQSPYSFRDFPLRPRFVFYHKGIEEVRQKNLYAGLLCSLMYTELFQKNLGPMLRMMMTSEIICNKNTNVSWIGRNSLVVMLKP